MHAHPRRILAVASAGGHWIQLMRLAPAFADSDVSYLTTDGSYREWVKNARFYVVRDSSRHARIALVVTCLQVLFAILRERPKLVVTTGAAPGFFAVLFGRIIGAKTVWIDSLANVTRLSLSARLARSFSSLCLTQWEGLAAGRVRFLGRVV